MFEQIWTFLHIGVMFTAVGVSVVPELLLHRMAESGDVTGVRSFGRVFQRLGKLIPLLFGLGALLGLAAAYFSHFDLLRPWLIIAYVLFAISGAWRRDPGTLGRQTRCCGSPESRRRSIRRVHRSGT